ncbi:hypothetical protein CQ020_03765 [Arthrobacter sp. MYb23]|uniref:DUF5403 family protein n=1 Tax=unclassified Arthrobacter TaxID=235627 RepID=UPI000CFCE14E|nr:MULTISPECIES: DUF5403 family protein [unclassified Arthrobacter]PRB44336.1 hypothetical protein CQ038_03620 [Arthrobacter sp. MYb51]PRB98588.1 hypothetical protein CQ020_03765 [Arthrobacter sp. MYb23]
MAEWLGFNGPLKGPGSVEDIVSHLPAVRSELKAQGSAIAARARSNLSLHRDNGDARIAVISPPKTKLDWHVALYDEGAQDNVPDRTDNANKSALSIELGHWQKTKKGRVWVDGIHALGNAVEDRVRKYGKTS